MSRQHQPQNVPMMQISAGGNRNLRNIPMGADGREWSDGLCSCGSCSTFCLACFCPCIAFSKVKHRYEHLEHKGYPDPGHGGGCCTCDCLLHCLLYSFALGWVLQMTNRKSIRTRYRIKGGCCGDCLSSCCCTPCQLSQESAELELEERSWKRYSIK